MSSSTWEFDPDAPNLQKWINMIPAYISAMEDLDKFIGKYGMDCAHIAMTVTMDCAPERQVLQTERYRYLNTKLNSGEATKATKLFVPPPDPREG